jgi:vacuolar-type H+-ATPase subunit I/STV1
MVKILIMEKWVDKIKDKIFDSIVSQLGAFAIALGITTLAIYQFIKTTWNKQVTVSIGNIIIAFVMIVFVLISIYLIILKLKRKAIFKEGDKVTLSTQRGAIMSAGNYNFWNNKVNCATMVDKTIVEKWINQNQLVLYQRPEPKPATKSDYWRGYEG